MSPALIGLECGGTRTVAIAAARVAAVTVIAARAAKVAARKVGVPLAIAPQVGIARRVADPLVASALMVRADLAGIAKPRCASLVAHGAGAH